MDCFLQVLVPQALLPLCFSGGAADARRRRRQVQCRRDADAPSWFTPVDFGAARAACNRPSQRTCKLQRCRNFATVLFPLRDAPRINRHGIPAPSWRLAFYAILSNLI
jgi:hypothetical protein